MTTYETYNGIKSTPMKIKKETHNSWPFTRAGTILLALLVIGFIAVANVSKGERTDENVTSDIARVTR